MLDTIMLMGVLAGILLGLGWLFFGFTGTVIALALAVILNVSMYWYADRIVLRMYRARPADDPKLRTMVERLAREARIPVPRVYVVDTRAPNAFATGRNPRHAAVAVTRGLLTLTDGEVEAVLSHEIGHIRNRDTLVSALAATIAGAVSFLAQIGYHSVFLGSRERGAAAMAGLVFVVIFAPLAAFLVRLAISRRREYRADYYGALLTRQPGLLSSALRKISAMAKEQPLDGNPATSHLWIVNPFRADRFTGLFATHPPIEKRVKRLDSMSLP
jgi:heat shock protein HtpX